MLQHPQSGRFGIFHGCRKLMLRRKPVIDRNNHSLREAAQIAAKGIVCLQRTHHPAAAVKVNDHGRGLRCSCRINARGYRPGGARNLHILRAYLRQVGKLHPGGHFLNVGAKLIGRHLVEWRRGRKAIQKSAKLGIDRHNGLDEAAPVGMQF